MCIRDSHIELIASENYASKRVLEAQGSILTNKYAEGYPSKRYYGGCENVDIAENLAIDRAKELFKADYANVQPHSGSSANAAAYLALLQPNDTILGMSLDHGGHLTHGSKVNFSGRNYKSIQYGLHPETHDIDYDQVRSLAIEHKPKLIIAGFSAFTGIIDWKKFREIADETGAYFLVDMAHSLETPTYPSRQSLHPRPYRRRSRKENTYCKTSLIPQFIYALYASPTIPIPVSSCCVVCLGCSNFFFVQSRAPRAPGMS